MVYSRQFNIWRTGLLPSANIRLVCKLWNDYTNWMFSFAFQYITVSCIFAAAKFCPTLCDPIDGSPPGSPVPGILQARTLEWVAISFSNAWKVKVKSLSRVQPSATPWTAAYQASPSMGFSRQEFWSGVPLPSPSCIFTKHKTHFIIKCKYLCILIFVFLGNKMNVCPADSKLLKFACY